ncbi:MULTISPECIES: hypothetical protein [Cyanophyceae]|uniref:hypothetical protein n=1 Tax=Cyanophyceae TaxID=3028117 RepID=UPI001687B226|nr:MULTISPECIES: hypothetical protein [Cyanophyceae]MBD1918756.1 hypothetical protein [Phormidium sp. FACHB-77]MBD2033409.1 hypothetical protein [Phormidium sp. FACHB-322]MBD2053908.1 hypothetical protein [Leptolyngbya sp. FACHB-60]
MKYFNPKTMKPNANQFYEAVKDKISVEGQKGVAYQAVRSLFMQAESLYRTLDFVTNEQIFTKSGKYLTHRQENDAIALTAMYAGELRTELIDKLIKEDDSISDSDHLILQMTLEIYKTTCEANYGALGNPRWIDD